MVWLVVQFAQCPYSSLKYIDKVNRKQATIELETDSETYTYSFWYTVNL